MLLDDRELDTIAGLLATKLNRKHISPPAPRLMDIMATASYLGRSVSAVTHMVKRRLLPVTKIDGRIQIDRVELDKLIAASTVARRVK